MMGALEAGSLEGVAKRLYNVFEEVLPEEMRQEVQGIKTVMLRCGAMGAAMSGSGPAVFGIFRTGEEAAPALESLRKWYVRSFAAQPVSWLDNL